MNDHESVRDAGGVRQPALYLSHGAPPLADDRVWTAQLRAWGAGLGKPKNVLMVSAHWENAPIAVSSTTPGTPLVYDFWGFPQHYYEVTYDAPVAPDLARDIDRLLGGGLHQDPSRGLDHGAYVPLVELFPDADVPVLQISLLASLNAPAHIDYGRALAPLRDEGVLIIGSGMSYHNMRGYGDPRSTPISAAFDRWLSDTVALPAAERNARLADWASASGPAGRLSHPPRAEEHLLPLHVVAGAAGDSVGRQVFSDEVLRTTISAFRFD